MKSNLSFPNSFLDQILPSWLTIQTLLSEVIRWSKFLDETDGHGGARTQNSLQHIVSISFFAIAVIQKLRLHVYNFDGELFLSAVIVHDLGEGDPNKGKQGDTHFIDKTESGDLGEYLQFLDRIKDFDPDLLNTYKRAFLLQFAIKNPECFPEDAREIMVHLAAEKTVECHAFNAIEKLDYLLYAIEQYKERGNLKILLQTLRNNVAGLNQLADKDLPAIAHVLWPAQLRMKFEKLIQDHEGKLIEQKGVTA